jgi:hypothetical protein
VLKWLTLEMIHTDRPVTFFPVSLAVSLALSFATILGRSCIYCGTQQQQQKMDNPVKVNFFMPRHGQLTVGPDLEEIFVLTPAADVRKSHTISLLMLR